MKVAIVLNTSWNIHNFRMGLIKAFLDRGIEVYAVAPYDQNTPDLIEAGCNYVKVTMDSRGANPLKDMALLLELLRIYRRIKPDIILHFTIKPNIYGTFAAGILGIPVINNVCGLGTIFLQNSLISFVAKILYRLAFKLPRKVFFQNPDDRNLFVSEHLVDARITDTLPGSGIDLRYYQPRSSDAKSRFTFLVISRLIHDKGILEYIDAIQKLKEQGIEADFQLLGPPDPSHKRGIPIKTLNTWIDLHMVDYLGTTSDVRDFIDRADCVILPSYREGTPRTLLEAACLAKPLIATNVPGCTNVVEDEINGLLCQKGDSQDLADKMLHMYRLDNETRRQMGRNGRKKVESTFDQKIVIDKYLKDISNLIPKLS